MLIEDRSGLLSYALLGMFLVPLRNIRFGHLVALVVALVLMAALCMPPRSARHSVPEQAASAQHSRSHSVDAATYVAGVGLRVEGLLHDAADGEPFQQWPLTLAMIILGFLAGREPRFKVLWTCARTLRTHIAAPALAGGLIGTIFAHAAQVGLVPLPEMAMNVIDVSAMGVLSVSYTIWLLAILQRPVAAQWLGPLAAAGRMALSNYIIQCASFVTLFSAYGVHARMNWAGGVVLGLLLWVLQVAFSAIWLGHFSMGPIEYVWRLATYGYRTRHE